MEQSDPPPPRQRLLPVQSSHQGDQSRRYGRNLLESSESALLANFPNPRLLLIREITKQEHVAKSSLKAIREEQEEKLVDGPQLDTIFFFSPPLADLLLLLPQLDDAFVQLVDLRLVLAPIVPRILEADLDQPPPGGQISLELDRGDLRSGPRRVDRVLLVDLQLPRGGSQFLAERDSTVGEVGGRDRRKAFLNLVAQFSILVPFEANVEILGREVGQSLAGEISRVGGEKGGQSLEKFDQPFVMDRQRGGDLAEIEERASRSVHQSRRSLIVEPFVPFQIVSQLEIRFIVYR